MRNADLWRPTKFEYLREGLRASRDPRHVSSRSRIIVDLIAREYGELIRLHAKGRLLDVGCGHVPLYGAYRDRTDLAICVDWGNSLHQSPCTDAAVDLNSGIPFGDDFFDTVVATDVLEHVRAPAVFWAEAARVLRRHGTLILGVPFLYGLHEEPHDYHRYTRHGLSWACDAHGLKVVDLYAYGGPLAVVCDLVGKNLPGAWHVRGFQAAACAVLRSGLGQRIDKRYRERFPLGYCLVARKR